MKTFLKILVIALLGWVLQLFLPWWNIMVAAFLVNAIIYSSGWTSFMSGFWAIFLLWSLAALSIDISSNSLLSEKIAQIFQLDNSILLVLVAALIGGLAGGFSALSGSLLRNIFGKTSSNIYYK